MGSRTGLVHADSIQFEEFSELFQCLLNLGIRLLGRDGCEFGRQIGNQRLEVKFITEQAFGASAATSLHQEIKYEDTFEQDKDHAADNPSSVELPRGLRLRI